MTCKDRTQRIASKPDILLLTPDSAVRVSCSLQGRENRFLLVSSDPVTQVFICALMTAEASVSVGCRCVKTEHLFAPSHPRCFSHKLLGRLCRSWLGDKGEGGSGRGYVLRPKRDSTNIVLKYNSTTLCL